MARDMVDTQYPNIDVTNSAGVLSAVETAIAPANGIAIRGFFNSKDNAGKIFLNMSVGGELIIRAGDGFKTQNGMGDLSVDLAVGVNVITLERPARFENKDGTVYLDFTGANLAGTIIAAAKKAGLK
jgi:hypothetical protein